MATTLTEGYLLPMPVRMSPYQVRVWQTWSSWHGFGVGASNFWSWIGQQGGLFVCFLQESIGV